MSEQAAEASSGEQGSLNLSHASGAASEPTAATASEPAPAEMTAASAFEPSEAPKAEASAPQPEPEAATPEAAKPEISHAPGKVIVMSRGERAWTDQGTHAEPEAEKHGSVFGTRRIAAIAAVLALATVSGAVGGALTTATLMHGSSDVAMDSGQSPLGPSLSRIDTDIQSLKAGLDHTSKIGMSQFNKTTDRLDKLERAQAEPAAKLAKLSEAVDRLRAAPAATPVAAAAAAPATSSASKDTTGSITPASSQQASATPAAAKVDAKPDAKTEVSRLPTLDDWVLRDIGYGGAVIGGRRGTFEVYAGDMIPGLGRVDAIRRQDGRWVVVTSRGLIVSR